MLPRKLLRFEADKLIRHLCSLEGEDRRLRFGAMLPNDTIYDYVMRSFDDKSVWFVCGEHEIVAACHVAVQGEEAELGCSVDKEFRNLGLAQLMFSRAVTWLRAHGIREVYMHCLTENSAMRHIARKNEMTVESSYGESDARVEVEPPTPFTPLEDMYLDRIAIYDMIYRTSNKMLKRIMGVDAP